MPPRSQHPAKGTLDALQAAPALCSVGHSTAWGCSSLHLSQGQNPPWGESVGGQAPTYSGWDAANAALHRGGTGVWVMQHTGIQAGDTELTGIDNTKQAAPHPERLPWGRRVLGLALLLSTGCATRQIWFREAKATRARWASPQSPHGSWHQVATSRGDAASMTPCLELTNGHQQPPNPALYQPLPAAGHRPRTDFLLLHLAWQQNASSRAEGTQGTRHFCRAAGVWLLLPGRQQERKRLGRRQSPGGTGIESRREQAGRERRGEGSRAGGWHATAAG